MSLTERIYNLTLDYINTMPKSERKKIGQFFTPPAVANYMANLMSISSDTVNVLDAGAGSGILTGALCEAIIQNSTIQNIHVDLYENNKGIIPVLGNSMKLIEQRMKDCDKVFTYTIKDSNFINDNAPYWRGELGASATLYDIIISNPPYKKIGKDDREAVEMEDIVYGQPNTYFLFMAMAAKLLKDNGQMIFINPRSFSSGAYFQRFRQWFFNTVKLTNLHLFISREDVFNCDNILQETIILKAIKTRDIVKNITVTESENMYIFDGIQGFDVPYSVVVSDDEDKFMLIPTKSEDIEVIEFVKSWPETLISLGYRLKTGPVVDFRSTEFLSEEQDANTVPLFWAYNFDGYKIKFPVESAKKPQFILNTVSSQKLLIKNMNYLFVKRFTSKEESRRIQCAIYLAENFKDEVIGVENHLNYITKLNGNMSKEELYGLFVVLNSSYVDKYFRILNGSTQVNANEINTMPFPSKRDIIDIGLRALSIVSLTVDDCDRILQEVFEKAVYRNVV